MHRSYTPWPETVAARYRKLGLWQDKTLYQHFAEQVQLGQPALIAGGETLSYGELKSAVNRVAGGFMARGLRPGDSVILQLPNSPEFFIALLACCQTGIVPVLALPAHGAFELQQFSQQTGAKLLLAAKPAAVDIDTIVVTDDQDDWGLLLRAKPTEEFVTTTDCPIALLQVSGGTTGVPKLIPRSHNDYAYSILQSNLRCGTNTDTVMLIALPCGHNFPLSSPGSLGVLFAGGTVVLAPSSRAGVALPLMAEHRVTTVALVPALLKQWLLSPVKADLSHWQTVQVGGQRLDPKLAADAMAKFDVAIQQVFGMAEGLVCYTPLNAERDAVLNSQGLPMSPYDEIVIVDDDDVPVRDGEAGHLLTRGPYTVRGYFRAPGHNERAFTPDGFYRTGDIVRLRPDGQLEVCGRSKEQINRGGEKIACREIEELALEIPGIAYAALIGVADAILGEKSVLYVVSELPDPAVAIREHLAQVGIAAYKIPDRIEVICAMPLTAVGKIDKKALGGLANVQPLEPPRPSSTKPQGAGV